MNKITKILRVIKLAQKATKAALGSCPKCGYGFAGKKPSPTGGPMIKMDASDLKFDPTKPCPSCDLGSDEKAEKKNEVGFGEKYLVENTDSDEFYGPFYGKSDAESFVDDFLENTAEIYYWVGQIENKNIERNHPGETGTPPSRKDLKQFYKTKTNIIPFRDAPQDIQEAIAQPGHPSSAQIRELKDTADYWRDRYYKGTQEPKEPNVASTLKQIKLAQEAISDMKVKLTESEDKPLLPLLQEALKAEFQQWDLYYAYKSMLKGLPRDPIAEHFEEHAGDEAEHIDVLQRYIVGMGEVPTVQRRPIPMLEEPTIEAVVTMQLKFELEAVNLYKDILTKLNDTSPLKLEIENILIKEQEHAHDLQLLLRK